MITYLGSRTVGDFMPAAVALQVRALTDLQVKLAAQQALIASLQLNPPTILASLEFAQRLVVEIQAQIALGIELPSLQVQIGIATAFVASLEAGIAALVDLEAAFGTAGVHGYTYDGAANQLGPEFTSVLAGGFPGGQPDDHANAIVLATTIPAAWAALGKILVTS